MDFPFDKMEIYENILDAGSSVVYLSDIETYQLVYMTRNTLRILGRPADDTTYVGELCYKLLQGLEAPCPFCNNDKLDCDRFECWQYYNPTLQRYFSIRDKKLLLEGRALRMEVADDITELALEKQRLQKDLSAEKSLIDCIQDLSVTESHDRSVNDLLFKLCRLYDAERGYIFQFDFENDTFSNTYEWCLEGVRPEQDNLQNIPMTEAVHWIETFERGEGIRIADFKTEVSPNSPEYKVLAPQEITSLVAVPLLEGKRIVGFLGVDNPKQLPEDLSLMRSIAQFVANDMEKRRILNDLERTSNTDLLSTVFNRNRYTIDVKALEEEKKTSLGVIFLDLDHLKEVNDTYGHDRGDELIRAVAGVLCDFFPDQVYRIGGDEFVVLCSSLSQEEFTGASRRLRCRLKDARIGASFGAVWHFAGASLDEDILRADRLMYREKNANMDRGRPANPRNVG